MNLNITAIAVKIICQSPKNLLLPTFLNTYVARRYLERRVSTLQNSVIPRTAWL